MKKFNWNLIGTLLAIITLLISIRIIDNQNTVEFIKLKNENLEKENKILNEKFNEVNKKSDFSKWYSKFNQQREYYEKDIEIIKNELLLNKELNDSLLSSEKTDSIFLSYFQKERFKSKMNLVIDKARDSALLESQIKLNKILTEIIKNNDSIFKKDDNIIETLNKVIYFQEKQIKEYEIYFEKSKSSQNKINIYFTLIIILLILNLKIVRTKIRKLLKKL